MAILSEGTALAWEDSKEFLDFVRYHGISQLLHIWDRTKDRQGDELLWGDEVEYMLAVLDPRERNAKLSLRQSEILSTLYTSTTSLSKSKISPPSFQLEYGTYMVESIPGSPYTGSIPDLLSVESNMLFRRQLIRRHLKQNETVLTLSCFPRLGTLGVFTEPHFEPLRAPSSHSLFLPDEVFNPHVRYTALTSNIRKRRGSRVATNLPIFFDRDTPRPFVDPTIPPEDSETAALVDHIYMDAMTFGMGCCCLQITFQACNVNDARRIYDALTPVAPILLALTAACPAWRGYLADVDCRWNTIASSVDDRTEEERGLAPLKESRFRVPHSRCGGVDQYISADWINRPEYSDIPLPSDESIYDRLRHHGLDDLLSKHFSHLFIRDPLVIIKETLDQDDSTSSGHFETIQSTIWQSLRFKPPPPNSSAGWRVELRVMEVQISDFENAAFAVFVVLLSRAILSFHLNFYIPISKVQENMDRAQRRGAARHEKFFFRKDVYLPGHSPSSSSSSSSEEEFSTEPRRKLGNCFGPLPPPVDERSGSVDDEYEEMTLEEIMTGKSEAFPGLLTLVYWYLESLAMSQQEREKIMTYLQFIKARSDGTLLTTASWIRNFVRSHPAYKFDSVVSQEINYDLMVAMDQIGRGIRKEPTLLPTEGDVEPGFDV